MSEVSIGGTGGPPPDGRRSSVAPGSVLFDWLLTGLVGLVALGGYLIVKGGREGSLTSETLASGPALVLYAGAIPAILLLLWAVAAGRGGSPDPRVGLPPPYRVAVVGAILFVIGFALALVDLGSFGQDVVVGLVSPGALFLGAGATLIASGPVLSFGDRWSASRHRRATRRPTDRWSAVGLGVSAAWLLALPALFVVVAHPWVTGAGLALSAEPPFTTHTELYAVPLARPGSVRLTVTTGEDEVHPAVHPSGDRIAIARGPSVEALDIWMVTLDGVDLAQVTDTPDAIEDGLTWAPEGDRLAWWSDREDESPARSDAEASIAPRPNTRADAPAAPRPDVHLIDTWVGDANGARPRRLSLPDTDEGVESWSPDGTRLCGWLMVDGAPDVHTVGLDGADPVRVTTDPSEDWSCSWSPRGDRLAFHSLRDGDYEIMTVATDGTDERRLTDNDGMDMLPRWSPDGRRLAFISDRSGETEIYTMAPDGSDVRNVTQDPALDDGIYGIDWTPDGSTIIAASAGRAYAVEDDASERSAIGAIALGAAIVGLLVGLLLRFRPPPGTFAIAMGLTGLLVGLLGDTLAPIAAFVLAGIATDLVGAWASARPGPVPVAVAAAVAAGVLTAMTFVAGAVETGSAWEPELALGAIILAAMVGGACGGLAGRPAVGQGSGDPAVAGPPA